MRRCRLIIWLAVLTAVITLAGQSRADISNAAVLYLRIAPGARAAAMGEAYVAISDDATATHWNPAGLGSYPLADSWIETDIPERLRPIKGLAAIEQGGGSDYQAYEIWALTADGLARFDNKDWHLTEKFTTKTDQTVSQIVSGYFNVRDEERLEDMIRKVANANNKKDYADLEAFRERIMDAMPPPEEYDQHDQLNSLFDSLMSAYRQCRIDWSKVAEAEKHLVDGMKDSALTDVEADRILIAVEKSRKRFIPEELIIPYSVNFIGDPRMISTTGRDIVVGTDRGLAVYNGKRWRSIRVPDGLPSDTILCLAQLDGEVLIGTAAGPARYAGLRLAEIPSIGTLPDGSVTSIGARAMDNIWMIIDGRLYYYDGLNWSTTLEYRVMLDDTPERLAERFTAYGSPSDKQAWLDLYMEANAETGGWGVDYVERGVSGRRAEDRQEMPDDIMSAIGSGADSDETAAADTLEADTTTQESSVEATDESAEEVLQPVTPDTELEPGKVVRVPFIHSIEGRVNDMFVGRDLNLWVGTEYGLLYFNGKGWEAPGYHRYRIKPEDSFDDLVDAKHHDDQAAREAYAGQLRDINDLDEDPLEVGRVVRIYRNPNATEVRSIVRSGRRLYLATEAGLVEFDGVYWARAAMQGLGLTEMVDAHTVDDELWLVSEDKITIKASARNQLTLMHVKWLPELADDVYYEFLSYVAGTEGWGTFGGNITFITYGSMQRTSSFGDTLEDFTSFDVALTGSYGTALSNRLKVGISAKIMYSKLSDIGTGLEKGKGTSTGFAVDFGLLYQLTRKLTFGAALTNLGPKMAYIDASQADELPRNLAVGFAYKLMQTDYYHLLATTEVNKIMVGLDDGLSEELQQLVINSGAEFLYANIFALRAGYIYDQEGDVKTPTLGVGLALANRYKFDFSYIPSGSNEALKNTLRISLSVLP